MTGRQCIVLLAAVAAVTLAGCAAQPRSQYPVLAQTSERDDNLGCAGYDDEILKADAIRNAIHEEHADVVEDTVTGAAISSTVDPVSGVVEGVLGTMMRGRPYEKSVRAAEVRIVQLLVYKRRDACPAGPEGPSDQLALEELERLDTQLADGELERADYARLRREILDDLR